MLNLPRPAQWTPDLLEQLSPDFRYEVHEGNLVVLAAAMHAWHADTLARIWRLLTQRGRHAYIEQGVVLPGAEIRTCDIGVFAEPPPADDATYAEVRVASLSALENESQT